MNAYDFVHLLFFAMCRPLSRNAVQKLAYFSGVHSGELAELGFAEHLFGPYSPGVSTAVGRMTSYGLLTVTSGSGDAWYADLSSEGREAADSKRRASPDAFARIAAAAAALKKAGDLDTMTLNTAARAYFEVASARRPLTATNLICAAQLLPWRPSRGDISQSVIFLIRCELIQ